MDEQEWKQKLEKLKLNWRIQIAQQIAISAYTKAYEALEMMQVPQESREEFEPGYFAGEAYDELLVDLDAWKDHNYQSFFSDSSVPDEKRALLAEEFADFVEKEMASIRPPTKSE